MSIIIHTIAISPCREQLLSLRVAKLQQRFRVQSGKLTSKSDAGTEVKTDKMPLRSSWEI